MWTQIANKTNNPMTGEEGHDALNDLGLSW